MLSAIALIVLGLLLRRPRVVLMRLPLTVETDGNVAGLRLPCFYVAVVVVAVMLRSLLPFDLKRQSAVPAQLRLTVCSRVRVERTLLVGSFWLGSGGRATGLL